MDAAALVAAFRQRADDATEPYHYADADLYRWLTEAEKEACLRARLIYDDTSAFLEIPLSDGVGDYALSPLVDRIVTVTLTPSVWGRPVQLCLTGVDQMRGELVGLPRLAGRIGQFLRVWPRPAAEVAATTTLRIAAYRFPQFAIEADADEPEIPEEHQDGLVDWLLYRAYSTKDGELEDPSRAQAALAEFTARFGERPTADVLRRHRERRRVTTRYSGL